MTSSKVQYNYHVLPDHRSIRLITGKLDSASDELSCNFEIADLEKSPQYIAFSYCWGNQNDLKPLTCDGGTIMVTQNVLLIIRYACSYSARFWIDSVCINQKDISEKNQQVALMADIYSKAGNVIIWLGTDPYREAEFVFNCIRDVVRMLALIMSQRGKIDYLDPANNHVHWTALDGSKNTFTVPTLRRFLLGTEGQKIVNFYNLPWFSRSWVLQEVGLALEAFVVWGGKTLQWNPIGLVSLFLARYGKTQLENLGLATAVQDVCHIYTAFSPFTLRATFFHLLGGIKRLRASDPRDKVYSLLSHPTASETGIGPNSRLQSFNIRIPKNPGSFKDYEYMSVELLPSLQDQEFYKLFVKDKVEQGGASPVASEERSEPIIKADYNLSVSEVYRNVAIEHIKRTGSLEILTAVEHDPDTSDLPSPSWVPQWNESYGTQILGLYTSNFFASTNRSAKVTYSIDDPDVLIARGTVFTRVIYTSPLCNESSFGFVSLSDLNPVHNNAIMRSWVETSLCEYHEQGAMYPRSVMTTTTDGLNVMYPEVSLWKAYMRTWAAGKSRVEVDGFDPERDALDYWNHLCANEAGQAPEKEVLTGSERYRSSVATVANQRRFFLTKKMLFGLGAGAMRKGDWVAVLLGADVPFVLREIGGDSRPASEPFREDVRFQLVGECYVEGMMTGGAIKGVGVEVNRDIVLV